MTGPAARGLSFTARPGCLAFAKLERRKNRSRWSNWKTGFFAFCGVGNPDAFFGDLRRWNCKMSKAK